MPLVQARPASGVEVASAIIADADRKLPVDQRRLTKSLEKT